VVSDGRAALNESLANAERRIAEMARRAERVFNEVTQTLRSQSRVYADTAGEQFDQAQRYVVERVKSRPVTATLAGLGLGLLLGAVSLWVRATLALPTSSLPPPPPQDGSGRGA